MGSIDIVASVVLALFAVRGAVRGWVHESLSLVTLVASLFVGLRWMDVLGERIGGAVPGPGPVDTAAGFAVLFGLTSLTGSLAIGFVEKIWIATLGSLLNRLGGLAFGIFKGAIAVGFCVAVVRAGAARASEGGPLAVLAEPLARVEESVEASYITARIGDLTGGWFSAVMGGAGGFERGLATGGQP